MFFPILLFLPLTSSTYYAYPKDNEQTFPYDTKRVCKIRKYSSYNYVHLENAFDQFDRTAMKPLNDDKISACFNYRGYSYIFISKNNSSTAIVRGTNTTSKIFQIKLDSLYYDHLHSSLYVITFDAFLYQINLKLLHEFWNANWLKASILLGHKRLVPTLPLNNVTDAYIYNHTLYWLTVDGKVYKQRVDSNVTALVEHNYAHVKFDLIPFPVDGIKPSITITENPHIKISGLGGGFDPIFLQLPSALTDFVYTTNNIFLYVLDIIFVLCLIIILRIARKRNRKGDKQYFMTIPSKETTI